MSLNPFIFTDFTIIVSLDMTLGHLSVLPLKLSIWLFPCVGECGFITIHYISKG